MKAKNIIAFIMLVAGAALAVYGYYEYDSLQNSVENILKKTLLGNSDAEKRSVIIMISGGVAALVGLGMLVTSSKRRR